MTNFARCLGWCFLAFSTAAFVWADREADRRNERIPAGHQMHHPLHVLVLPFGCPPNPTGYTPQQMRHAYGFDQLGTTGEGQTIAIVDAYGSSTIQADLNNFCAQYGIPSTTVTIIYPQGQPTTSDAGWAGETSLDVEWAHAIAPGAAIDLVVPKDASTASLLAGVDAAVGAGAQQVSMSWGGSEFSTETSSDYHFNVSGVTFVASSGDSGAGAQFPACSPYVVAAGGTSLYLDSLGNVSSETGWPLSGGGLSAYESIPSYQTGWQSGSKRGIPDVAYNADNITGVPVCLSGSWLQAGGTSASAPQWAALFALANSLRSQSLSSAPSLLYSLASANYSGYFHDITSGNNGFSAGLGYDLVTGLGSPAGSQLVLALACSSAQVAPATFSHLPGTFTSSPSVAIATATAGATIRYTTDGSTPTETNGTVYSGPVSITTTSLLRAVAYASGLGDSPVNSGLYAIASSPAATVSVMYNFAAPNNGGIHPFAGLLLGSDGNFYGTTQLGGASNDGTIFQMTPDGGLTTLISFNETNGAQPCAGLIQGSDSNFYGTTVGGGANLNGTVFQVFKFGSAWGLNTLVSFASVGGTTPVNPYGGVVQGTDGNFYGTTQNGGSNGVAGGTVFQLTPAGTLTNLFSFNDSTNTDPNGSHPYAGLTRGSDGNFYGTTQYGGSEGTGTFFKITPAGALTTLASSPYNFRLSPAYTYSALVQGSDGNFYGTYEYEAIGGTSNDGNIYQLTPAGALTTLARFTGANGAYPYAGVVQGSDSNFYGATESGGINNRGTLFKLIPPTAGGGNWSLTSLLSFTKADGAAPAGNLIQGSDGNFYGTTYSGGSSNDGVIFKLMVPTQTAMPTFSAAPGTYAGTQSITITSATSGAAIRYTTDGSTPTETAGTIYSAPVSIGSTTLLQAIAYTSGLSDSPIDNGIYTITSSPASVLNVLYNFSFSNSGGTNPQANLIQGSDGSFYGTTFQGGCAGAGTAFRMLPTGILAKMYTFSAVPGAGLVQGSDGNFYGTTLTGGTNNKGTVFVLNPVGGLSNLVSFTGANGATPVANVVQGSDGNFYGTTQSGGSNNSGTVFTIMPLPGGQWGLTSLVSFNGSNGSSPEAPLVQGNDGNFYSTTDLGGSSNQGTVFKITPAGVLTTLVSFNGANGAGPTFDGLFQGNDGNFYGMTSSGGDNNDGTIFKITPAGALTTLVSFNSQVFPNGLVQGADGNFYGTTQSGGSSNDGTIFQLTPAGAFTTLVSFDDANGAIPQAALVQGTDGNFYGTTYRGGAFSENGFSAGVSFQLIVPQAVAPAFGLPSGTYSSPQTVTISATGGATIDYTTDGSTPSQTHGITVPSGQTATLTITATTTIKAIAYESGQTVSPLVTATYTIGTPVPTLTLIRVSNGSRLPDCDEQTVLRPLVAAPP